MSARSVTAQKQNGRSFERTFGPAAGSRGPAPFTLTFNRRLIRAQSPAGTGSRDMRSILASLPCRYRRISGQSADIDTR
ncbi:hypothetical protein DF049_27670 [Burkholderia cenocepacia]|nr:hypothetical protein DF049_27670 [Burkholderia cenocepacia]RQU95433.1 hypothetical protein DF042_30940 [Burkholderia cenocepacia]